LDELERVLGIGAFPVNWPIGNGSEFQGVYDRQTKRMHLFERTVGGQYRAPVQVGGLDDPAMRGQLDDATFHKTVEELEMLEHAGHDWDDAAVLADKTTPVFFGSASNNFGVQLLLDGFLKHAPGPKGRNNGRFGVPPSGGGARLSSAAAATNIENAAGEDTRAPNFIAPEHPAFSGFIFKSRRIWTRSIATASRSSGLLRQIRARHDGASLAFRKKVRLSSSHKLFGNERETVDEAYPGDVIGLVGHDSFGIGDTLTTDPNIIYKEIPRFTPEAFSYLHNPNTAKFKQFRQGLEQLMQEGVIQALYLRHSSVKNAVARRRRPAAIRGRAIPARKRIRRQCRASKPRPDGRALAAGGPAGSGTRCPVAADRFTAGLRRGQKSRRAVSQRMGGGLFHHNQRGVPLSALPVQTARELNHE